MAMKFSDYKGAFTGSGRPLSRLDATLDVASSDPFLQPEVFAGIAQELAFPHLRLSGSSSYLDAVLSAINFQHRVKRYRRPTPGHTNLQELENLASQPIFDHTHCSSQRQTVTQPPVDPVAISHLSFSGKEGDTGTFQIRLTQAPTSTVTLTFITGNFLVVDADATVQNGTQTTIRFTPQDWHQTRTVSFIAELDGVCTNRDQGNVINYTLTDGLIFNGVYDLGTIANTYTPDSSHFNIDLDFRNDYLGFWTVERRSLAQKAANDWAESIADEWTELQLNSSIKLVGNDGYYTDSTFTTQRYVDDLVVFVGSLNSNGLAGGFGGPEYDFGGWVTSPDLMPRVAQITIDITVGDEYLYNVVAHEIGHALGLVGLNWVSYLQQDLTTPQTAVFQGGYSRAANGGNDIPLQSQDGANPITGEYDYWHPAAQVYSIMSYQWLYDVSGPTTIDYAMLADSGYSIYGVTASLPATRPTIVKASDPSTSAITTTSDTSSSTSPVTAEINSSTISSTANTSFQRPTPAARAFACSCLVCSGRWTALNPVSDLSAAIAQV
ncbi:MAG: hypothetical protein HC866_10140 [Leptolyngbyaceae cyanobacterium RU_5_1]|nr:hypothetical protein [Leptolyngbyaceae cyanobacterium RU_5_1]